MKIDSNLSTLLPYHSNAQLLRQAARLKKLSNFFDNICVALKNVLCAGYVLLVVKQAKQSTLTQLSEEKRGEKKMQATRRSKQAPKHCF